MIVTMKFVAKNERDWIPAPVPDTSSLTTLRSAQNLHRLSSVQARQPNGFREDRKAQP